MKYFSTTEKALFADWARREKPFAESRPAVKLCHRLSAAEEGPFFRRLAAAGMGELRRTAEVQQAMAEARGRPLDADSRSRRPFRRPPPRNEGQADIL